MKIDKGMNVISNKEEHLSEHFSLGEVTKTQFKTADGNVPNQAAIDNLKNICVNWLEDLRFSYNLLYCMLPGEDYKTSEHVEPLIINQGFRSVEVMEEMIRKGYHPSPTSNHLTGCAVDIRCLGLEQAIRYAAILLDIADSTKKEFDELFIERNKSGSYWIHFAVRPKVNRRKVSIMKG